MKHTLFCSTALAALLLTACCGPLNPKKPLPNIEEVKKHVEEKVEKIEEKVEQKVEEVEKKVEQVEEKVEKKVEEVEKKIERVFIPLESRLATQANWHFYQTGEQLDWEHSIVDLLKLVDYDSSFSSRKELAESTFGYQHYRGTSTDNLWLHAQVIEDLR